MNKLQQARLEQLKEAYVKTLPQHRPDEFADLVQFALPALRKIARSGVEIETAVQAVLDYAHAGTTAPAMMLGIIPKPKYAYEWMANVSVGRTEFVDPIKSPPPRK